MLNHPSQLKRTKLRLRNREDSAPSRVKKQPLVLVVEDDARTLKLLGQVLRRGGYRSGLAKMVLVPSNCSRKRPPH